MGNSVSNNKALAVYTQQDYLATGTKSRNPTKSSLSIAINSNTNESGQRS